MGLLRIVCGIGAGVIAYNLIKHAETPGEFVAGCILAGVTGKLAVDEIKEVIEATSNSQPKRLGYQK